jgi:hypothetical protein
VSNTVSASNGPIAEYLPKRARSGSTWWFRPSTPAEIATGGMTPHLGRERDDLTYHLQPVVRHRDVGHKHVRMYRAARKSSDVVSLASMRRRMQRVARQSKPGSIRQARDRSRFDSAGSRFVMLPAAVPAECAFAA